MKIEVHELVINTKLMMWKPIQNAIRNVDEEAVRHMMMMLMMGVKRRKAKIVNNSMRLIKVVIATATTLTTKTMANKAASADTNNVTAMVMFVVGMETVMVLNVADPAPLNLIAATATGVMITADKVADKAVGKVVDTVVHTAVVKVLTFVNLIRITLVFSTLLKKLSETCHLTHDCLLGI